MRPRVFPAEDRLKVYRGVDGAPSFNEAAGIPRGRPLAKDAENKHEHLLQ